MILQHTHKMSFNDFTIMINQESSGMRHIADHLHRPDISPGPNNICFAKHNSAKLSYACAKPQPQP